MSDWYYTPVQKEAQEFFEEYIPISRIMEEGFAPDLSHIIADPTPTAPETPDLQTVLVYELLRRLTATPYGTAALIGAYGLAYLPLLEPTKTSKIYGPSELMTITSGVGGAMRV